MKELAIKELLYKMADDLLILGHRNSEWTGIGPILEEDIAFSSMAQDKVGQSWALYKMLQVLGEQEPDTVAFTRNAPQFHSCKFVELPIGEYDFSLVRHFLFDTADLLRFDLLSRSSYTPLAQLATKIKGELKYHTMHANTWIKQLGSVEDEEAFQRMQYAIDAALPFALGIFEEGPYEQTLADEQIFAGEAHLKLLWLEKIQDTLSKTQLVLGEVSLISPELGGRYGQHTEFLQPLLDEMTEVFKVDPTAEW
jgi:ring-1,2-phenylacetyl-CoA epoxidase subunit PaaC